MNNPTSSSIEGAKSALKNANSQYEIAIHLAGKGNYGIATSLLVLSAEEAIKAYLIFCKGLFPSMSGESYSKVFKDHRYKLQSVKNVCFMVQLVNTFYDVINKGIEDHPNSSIDELKALKRRAYRTLTKMLKKENEDKRTPLSEETKWWDRAKALKEDGFYVRPSGQEWHAPQQMSKDEFVRGSEYVKNLIEMVEVFEYIDFKSALWNELMSWGIALLNHYYDQLENDVGEV